MPDPEFPPPDRFSFSRMVRLKMDFIQIEVVQVGSKFISVNKYIIKSNLSILFSKYVQREVEQICWYILLSRIYLSSV